MTETVGEVLVAFQLWLRAAAGLGGVAIVNPSKAEGIDGISLVLHRLERGERPRSNAGDPIMEALLLILAGGKDPVSAATLGGEVMFALYDESWIDTQGVTRSLRLEPGESADRARRQLGLPAGLAIMVRLPIHRQRRRGLAPPVLHPMRLETEDMSVLEGVVLGEIDGMEPQPLANARIEASDYGRYTTSDGRGRFRIPGLPAKILITLTVSARQHTHAVSIEANNGVVLRLPTGQTVENLKHD